MVPTAVAVIWCEPSPVKRMVRRDGSARAAPSAAPVAQPIEPHSGAVCISAPSGSGSGKIPEFELPLSRTIRSFGVKKSRYRGYRAVAEIGSLGLPPAFARVCLRGAEYLKFLGADLASISKTSPMRTGL